MAKMRNFDSRDNKNAVRALADYIEECARENLASNEKLDQRKLNDTLIEDAMNGVRREFDGLTEIIGPFFADDPRRLEDTYGLIWHLVYKPFIIGVSMAASPELRGKIEAEINHGRTMPANNVRRRDDIQNIITRHALKLWARKPCFKGNDRGSAREICQGLFGEIAKLENIPKDWGCIINSDNAGSQFDTIARRIARIQTSDE